MSAKISDLESRFRPLAAKLILKCAARGIAMWPTFTIRSPVEQAKLWRQSRSDEEVRARIAAFRDAGADFLAFALEEAGPQNGPHVTNVGPGFSWHQWGEALDCVWVVGGTAEWSTTREVGGLNGYRVYAEEAKTLGLEAGGYWESLKDWGHVQLRSTSNPGEVFTVQEIDAEMRRRFAPKDVAVPLPMSEPVA